MKRNNYTPPLFTITVLIAEYSIAESSGNLNLTEDSLTPNVEEFIEDETTITGFGDI
ncbi:hypothetical protein [Sphingobacterium rhinopitheci]|uniref:hypothetical protein n=1 Tax=Sphingobacterium rhinopitheci TaxID=2781960 RepID=UPI001F516D6E|nr:hypothetical protein [Sphingobacterium rhinopitheci]MCI0921812.1 hypothetical protein [Sphingobacterium rhinopitheci]